MNVDIVVVGAGPAGLCFARALADTGLSILLVEQQPLESLREPAFDGRDIALTRRSVQRLQDLGIWHRLALADVSPLRRAHVLDGRSPQGLRVAPVGDDGTELGFLVPNHRIRRAAYASVEDDARITIASGVAVRGLNYEQGRPLIQLTNGASVSAQLVVAADSRFSPLRREAGIAADMHDFGKSMLVCRMSIEHSHESEALEWFGHGQTLALLPLQGNQASVVLTLPGKIMKEVMALDDDAFNDELCRRFDHRFGNMHLTSTRHTYPLVGVYARRFTAQRLALLGDAAVGMHPVTAHGFNLGLHGVDLLASEIRRAHREGRDIGAPELLRRYERAHRIATRPLYLATLAIVKLYTDDRLPARLARRALLHASQATPPFRLGLARMLAAEHRLRCPAQLAPT